MSPGSSAVAVRAAVAVEDRLYRALAVLRAVVLLNCLGTNAYGAFWQPGGHPFRHPVAAGVVLAVIVVWTAVAVWAYADGPRRGTWLLAADLVVTLVVLGSTPLVKVHDYQATVPGFWVMGALLSWAVRFGPVGGLVAGGLLAVVDLVPRAHVDGGNYGNAFLLVIGGPIVGFVASSLKRLAAERDVAQRAAAAAEERTRLARVVHDGVLQVLALVQRRGAELGGVGAELGRLAGEQEAALRTMIRSQDAVAVVPVASVAGGTATLDLADRLGRLGVRPGVDVVLPGGAVVLPAPVVAEVVAVVAACLDNVARHVGEGAPAWVLLEAFDDRVEVSVRDEGPGIPEGRLAEAAAQGRLGVAESIRGRVRDLGGTATLTTGGWGTEWELSVPRGGAR